MNLPVKMINKKEEFFQISIDKTKDNKPFL